MKKILALAIIACIVTGCMSEREAWLRGKSADNQKAHSADFEVWRIKGAAKIELEDGAEMSVKAPTQPFVPLQVPDGMEAQKSIVRDVVTGAVIGVGLHEAGNTTSNKTINNNTGATP